MEILFGVFRTYSDGYTPSSAASKHLSHSANCRILAFLWFCKNDKTIFEQTNSVLFFPTPVNTYFALLIKSSYRYRCLFDKRHITTCSYFLGICFSTSDFSRRNKNGRRTLCNRWMIELLYSVLPSIMPVIGFENHSLNSRCDWNTCGMRKCMSDQSSIKLFCNGVPVSSSRLELKKNNC